MLIIPINKFRKRRKEKRRKRRKTKEKTESTYLSHSVADPGFPIKGGIDLVGGMLTPEAVAF